MWRPAGPSILTGPVVFFLSKTKKSNCCRPFYVEWYPFCWYVFAGTGKRKAISDINAGICAKIGSAVCLPHMEKQQEIFPGQILSQQQENVLNMQMRAGVWIEYRWQDQKVSHLQHSHFTKNLRQHQNQNQNQNSFICQVCLHIQEIALVSLVHWT